MNPLIKKLRNFVDFLNREGFEWFMQPRKGYYTYLVRSRGTDEAPEQATYPRFRFFARYALSLLMLPLLTTSYVINRLIGVGMNPSEWSQNPLKAFLVLFATFIPPLLLSASVGFVPLVNALIPVVGSLAGVIVIGAVAMSMAIAAFQYLMKTIVQNIPDTLPLNSDARVTVAQASTKHTLSFRPELVPLAQSYRALLVEHQFQKALLNSPDPEKMNRQDYDSLQTRYKEGKELLYAFKTLIIADSKNQANPEMLEALKNVNTIVKQFEHPDSQERKDFYCNGFDAVQQVTVTPPEQSGRIMMKPKPKG